MLQSLAARRSSGLAMTLRRPHECAPPARPPSPSFLVLATILVLGGVASSGPVPQTSAVAVSSTTALPSTTPLFRVKTTTLRAVGSIAKETENSKRTRSVTRRRGRDDDDDDDGMPFGLGSLPGLSALPKLGVGNMGPMSLLPALLPLGMLPTSLAQLAAAVLAASTLGQFALGRALMQLVRDFVFGPRPGPLIIYKNKGWDQHRMPHAPLPVANKVPPEIQSLLQSSAMANLPMKPGIQPHLKYVSSKEVPEPPFSLHDVYKHYNTHEVLQLPPGLKFAHQGYAKLPPAYKSPHTLPHHHGAFPPEQSLHFDHPKHNIPVAEATPQKEEEEEKDTAGPIYEFPTDPHGGQLKLLQEPTRGRVPLVYQGRPIPPPAPVTEEAETRRWPTVALPPHHAELLRLPHPHPAILPISPPTAPQLPDYHLHVVKHAEER